MRYFIRRYLLKVLLGFILFEIVFLFWKYNKNTEPEIKPDSYSVYARHKIELRPLINDMDKDKDSIFIVDYTEPLFGKVSQKGELFYYKSSSNVQVLDSFAYIISDGKKKSLQGYIKIEVVENKEPISLNDTLVVYNGGANELQVLANDIDKENDSIYIDSVSSPLFGKVEIKRNKIYYKSKQGFKGIDSFNYKTNDGFQKSENANVQLIVKNGNFSSDPYYGNALNYTYYKTGMSDILIDNNNKRLALINDPKIPWSDGNAGGYCIINDRHYKNDFNLRFKAKTVHLKDWVEYAVIFSYKDSKNYSCIYFFYQKGTGQIDGYSIKNGYSRNTVLKNIKLYTDTNFHDLEVQKRGDAIIIKFDGEQVLNATNPVFLEEGGIGFGTNSSVYIDDVYVTGK